MLISQRRGNKTMTDAQLRSAVLRVRGGRGFVVRRPNHRGHGERIVVTAAHCLPSLPPCHPWRSESHESTYKRLIGPLGAKPTVWAHCLFADPVADIAVLGQPDNQDLSDEADAYDQLVESMETLAIGNAPAEGREPVNRGR